MQYTIVMGDFNAKVGGQINTSERATGCFGLGQRSERGDIMNTKIQEECREEMDMEKP